MSKDELEQRVKELEKVVSILLDVAMDDNSFYHRTSTEEQNLALEFLGRPTHDE